MQQQLNWPTLQQRRQRARLVLFYKAMQNTITLEIPHTTIHSVVLQDIIINHLSFIYPIASSRTNLHVAIEN